MSVEKNLARLFSLEGKVVVLTGAAGGIGSEIARSMASVGAHMVLCDLKLSDLEKIKKDIESEQGKAEIIELNLMDRTSIDKCIDTVIDRLGQVDVLINCAGINKREGCLDVDEATYDRIMDVNLKGAFFLTQGFARHMVQQKSGSIIHISSHNAVSMLGGCGVYGASKSGLTAITRAQAIEWAKHGIRVNAVAPGHIQTPLTTPLWTDPDRSQYLLDRIAMNRAGTPQDLVGIMILLASDASAYMTGLMYHVDGGCLAGGQPWKYDTQY